MNVDVKIILLCLLCVSVTLQILKAYHGHYLFHAEAYRKADLYLQSDVCSQSELKAELGDWHKCTESREQLQIPVYLNAFYSTIDNYSICGVTRCDDFLEWFYWNKFWVMGILFAAAFFTYYWLMYNLKVRQMNLMTKLALPNRRFNHVHVD